jgi:hypothetical protein
MKKALSPIDRMIDAACGVDPEPEPIKLTVEQKEACSHLGRSVVSDLRYFYPGVVKTRPATWPLHLRNTISNQAEMMLKELFENAQANPQ